VEPAAKEQAARNHPYWTKVQYTRVTFSVYLYTTKSVDAPTLVEA
jgi:hypothetical protein